MTASEKLFALRIYISIIAVVLVLISYVLLTTYSNEIDAEVARMLNDSFGHLKGELANL